MKILGQSRAEAQSLALVRLIDMSIPLPEMTPHWGAKTLKLASVNLQALNTPRCVLLCIMK